MVSDEYAINLCIASLPLGVGCIFLDSSCKYSYNFYCFKGSNVIMNPIRDILII